MEQVLNFMNKIRFSGHSTSQQFLFRFSQAFTKLQIFIDYLWIGIFFSTMYITAFNVVGDWVLWNNTVEPRYADEQFKLQSAAGLAVFVYVVLVGSLIFFSLQVSARQFPFGFRLICHVLGGFMLATFGALVWLFLSTILLKRTNYFSQNVEIMYLILIYFGCYVILILANPSSIVLAARSVFAYIYYLPSYLHSFIIYSFCRIDDFSMGTKPGGGNEEENKKTLGFKNYKVDFASTWIILNGIVGFMVVYLNTINTAANYFYVALGKQIKKKYNIILKYFF